MLIKSFAAAQNRKLLFFTVTTNNCNNYAYFYTQIIRLMFSKLSYEKRVPQKIVPNGLKKFSSATGPSIRFITFR